MIITKLILSFLSFNTYNLFHPSSSLLSISIIFPIFATEMKPLTDTQYIRQLVSEGEHCHQDFKFEISDARKIARSLSAFANTEGGRLLVGVKDNGKIAGIRSEEEIYMIEAAATMYCCPKVEIETRTYLVEGKSVLEVSIGEMAVKPVYALDEKISLGHTSVSKMKISLPHLYI